MTKQTVALLPNPGRQSMDYLTDAWQRNILFWDVLRQRSQQHFEQQKQNTPHVLHFQGEILINGRTLEKPVNYGLVRIIPPKDIKTDPLKRPFVVVDPRAGHGPGIGGFKADSEIGAALAAGHPCYFIGFTPNPEPDQTIEDVMHAEAIFLEEVIRRHPDAEGKPCIIGNCQAGWAVMMLAATHPELCGPLIIPGAPLSYWAGLEGVNPMRYSGGLLGGSWLTTMVSDIGNGKFDGAWLVSNFENLDPSNTLWGKLHNLWANVDTEGPRFLEFEKWWGSHVTLNGEEIQWIVDQLFIGNRLATGQIITKGGVRIDLRKIRTPILCFCSEGDNITPPQQALGWITDLYEHDNQIKANGQTIIYSIHDSIGHLGIFVSGKVARKEHTEFTSNIDLIDVLPPGLYEAVMVPKNGDTTSPELVGGDWILRFEPRTLSDIRHIVQPSQENERRFAAVSRVSEINQGLYRTFLQPLVKAMSNEQTAQMLRRLEPSLLPIELFSDRNPFMNRLAKTADCIRKTRKPTTPDNPMWIMHQAFSDTMISILDLWRDWRDENVERIFISIYGSPITQAMMGLKASDESPRPHPGFDPEYIQFVHQRIAELKSSMAEGDAITAAIRALVYIGMGSKNGVDERSFNALISIREAHSKVTLEEFKTLVRQQFFRLLLAKDEALAAIPAMLPTDAAERKEILAKIRKVVTAIEMDQEKKTRLAKIEALFEPPKVKQTPKPK